MAKLRRFEDISEGLIVPPLTVDISRQDLVKYAGASDDYMPQHWDHPYMTGQGYSDVVVHGWLTFAHMCRAVTDWAAPDIAVIAGFAVRYHKTQHPGLLECGGTVTAADGETAQLSLWGKSGAAETVASGQLTLKRFTARKR